MVNENQVVGFLERVPLFQSLNNRQLKMLAKRFVEREYPADTVIVEQGRGGEGFFIIESGMAEAIRLRNDDSQVKVNHFGPTDFFGEMALLDDGLRTASVVTTEATRCLVLTRWDFLGALKEDSDMAISVLKELAKRFRITLDAMQ